MLEKSYEILPFMSAKNMGSGDLDVLATPALVAIVENFSKSLIDLKDSETSVGTFFDIVHLKATKIGSFVDVKITKIEINNKKALFEYEVFEKEKLIAKGVHKRAVVETSSFLEKLDS